GQRQRLQPAAEDRLAILLAQPAAHARPLCIDLAFRRVRVLHYAVPHAKHPGGYMLAAGVLILTSGRIRLHRCAPFAGRFIPTLLGQDRTLPRTAERRGEPRCSTAEKTIPIQKAMASDLP